MAGLLCAADLPVGLLEPFAVPSSAAAPSPAPAPATASTAGRGRLVYAGPGWVGGRLRQVESRRCRQAYRLRIEGVGELLVGADGASVSSGEPVAKAPVGEDLAAALLGPGLVLALALRGIWCLHASAAGPDAAAVALAGESGSGKSTLAAALAALDGWRRIGDDILPLSLRGAGAVALPRFPQPNLAPELQWRPPAPGRLDLAEVCLLEPGGEEVRLRRSPRRAAALALVRQTVGARLFDRDLQAVHLEFCAELAGRLPVRVLRFPRRQEALPEMVRILAGG